MESRKKYMGLMVSLFFAALALSANSVYAQQEQFNYVIPDAVASFTADDGSIVEMVMPGDRIKMTAELIYPVAIEEGMRFAIREGGRTIGAGVVSKIVK